MLPPAAANAVAAAAAASDVIDYVSKSVEPVLHWLHFTGVSW